MNRQSYDEIFVEFAQDTLGHAFDWVANTCDADIQEFARHLASSRPGILFGRGCTRYTMGMNGAELVNTVMEDLGLPEYEEEHEFWVDRSREYWVGWILAYYQWRSGHTFQEIVDKIPMEKLQRLYHLGHEQDEEHVADTLDEWIQKAG